MENKQKNRKGYTIILLVLLLAVSIGGIYGYWAGAISNPDAHSEGQEITIGQGKDVNTIL